jgi:hypothetical protein
LSDMRNTDASVLSPCPSHGLWITRDNRTSSCRCFASLVRCNRYCLRQTSANKAPFGFEVLCLDKAQFSDHIVIARGDEFTVH